MSSVSNIIIQVRSLLRNRAIKLWELPYYVEGIGCDESEVDRLAQDFSEILGLSTANCRLALIELQDGAINKLADRKEFQQTGVATLNVRRVKNEQGTQNIFNIKCKLTSTGADLFELIAQKLQLENAQQMKVIASGKVLDPHKTLETQGIQNSHQMMLLVSEPNSNEANKLALHDQIQKIISDVEAIVDAKRQMFELEDQAGNPVFLPPQENRCILLGMSLYEKARAAIKNKSYDEALILLLEADEKFKACSSNILASVDNYALVNLDIVWCYLCLKNVTQLPDAERRLKICEDSFNRSYGKDLSRVLALKENAVQERALLLRLNLLQGVVHFHQNERNLAYSKFQEASIAMLELNVDEQQVTVMQELGFEPWQARVGLRAGEGDVNRAIDYLEKHKTQLKEARERSKKERQTNRKFRQTKDDQWVNPRTLTTIIEMGFERRLATAALRKTKNDLEQTIDLLQNHAEELRQSMPALVAADQLFLQQLEQLGFDPNTIRLALETHNNNIDRAVEFIVKMYDEKDLLEISKRLTKMLAPGTTAADGGGPSTSTGRASLSQQLITNVQKEIDSLKAYERFQTGISFNEEEYLDDLLLQQEQILLEYMRFLPQ